MATETETKGIVAQHRDRMENDSAYRDAALTAPADVRGKYLTNTAPTTGAADRDAPADEDIASTVQRPRPIDGPVADGDRAAAEGGEDKYTALAGQDLEDAVRDADIEGRSSMSADEKRAALRAKGW
jgi:hypothetical protein